MRIFVSFFLTLIAYSINIFFFVLIFNQPKKKKEVLIHTAIVVPANKKSIINTPKSTVKKQINKQKNKPVKKIVKKIKKGSISAFTKGGKNIKINDIFKTVNYNVDTEKIKRKSQLDMSRYKGIEEELKKVKTINFNVSLIGGGGNLSDKEIENLIVKKLSPLWNNISNIIGEYAKINIVFDGSKTNAYILESNLDENRQRELIGEIEKLTFDKKFDITVKFITKANK
ncbi:hypothetical protein [Lebetimonas sp. JH369]|uniref:hypothetical protein n=1 Tax=Lebetimonas sp. JH369 TaxID=990069 RepID=UPI000465CE2D|nr:hypothetical protein [Lebetimonas sp. JH369]